MLLIRGLYYIPTNQTKYYNNKLIKITIKLKFQNLCLKFLFKIRVINPFVIFNHK